MGCPLQVLGGETGAGSVVEWWVTHLAWKGGSKSLAKSLTWREGGSKSDASSVDGALEMNWFEGWSNLMHKMDQKKNSIFERKDMLTPPKQIRNIGAW